MIKILKPGRDQKIYAVKYEKTCQRCGCEFELEIQKKEAPESLNKKY